MSLGSTSAFEDEEDKFCLPELEDDIELLRLLELEDDFESLQMPALEDDVGSFSGTSVFVGLLLSSLQLTKRKIADKEIIVLAKFFIFCKCSD